MAELVWEVSSQGVSIRFAVLGGSMSPWIRSGDVVTVTPVEDAGPVRSGTVAAFRLPGSETVRVHRLRTRTANGWVAQADRNRRPDGIIPESAIAGVVTAVERGGRRVYLPTGGTGLVLSRLTRAVLVLRARIRSFALFSR
jgi:hypothetical protein